MLDGMDRIDTIRHRTDPDIFLPQMTQMSQVEKGRTEPENVKEPPFVAVPFSGSAAADL